MDKKNEAGGEAADVVLSLVGNQSEKTGALKGGFELLLLFLKL